MERISIFNYEAFYLDFLEGNLNEEDTLLLMNFLEENPELNMEIDELLPAFNQDEIKLDDFSKLMLKSDFEDVEIDESNINQFIVAETEGLLSQSKVTELDAFTGDNPVWNYERKLANKVILKPEMEIIYDDKASLKQRRRIIVLWPYASAIAAACIVFFFYWVLTSSPEKLEVINQTKQKASTKIEQTSPKEEKPIVIEKRDVIQTAKNASAHLNNENKQKQTQVNKQKLNKKETNSDVDKMNSVAVGPIASINEQKLAPIHNFDKQEETQTSDNEESVLAFNSSNEMHNPIEPLTKFVTKKTNTEVDFQTTKKTENERRGFYLKVGKFEVSRNKR